VYGESRTRTGDTTISVVFPTALVSRRFQAFHDDSTGSCRCVLCRIFHSFSDRYGQRRRSWAFSSRPFLSARSLPRAVRLATSLASDRAAGRPPPAMRSGRAVIGRAAGGRRQRTRREGRPRGRRGHAAAFVVGADDLWFPRRSRRAMLVCGDVVLRRRTPILMLLGVIARRLPAKPPMVSSSAPTVRGATALSPP